MTQDYNNVISFLSRSWFNDKNELRKAREYIKEVYPDVDKDSFNLRYYCTKNMPESIKNKCIKYADLVNFINMRKGIRVYIASPYTFGDVAINVRNQMQVVDELINEGYLPFCPLYFHFQHIFHPRPYTDWLRIDISWMLACHCVLRLDGESKGADEEVRIAKENNIPVVYSIEELNKLYNEEE